jgi:hypothetical protein
MSAAIQSMRAVLSRRCLATPMIRCAQVQTSFRTYTSLPVLQHYVPRAYPFDVVLTTDLIPEEDLQWRPANPHDLPRYKSTLRVNLDDIPLSEDELYVFRLLVGRRIYSDEVHDHPIPSWITPTKRERLRKASSRQGKRPDEVKFTSSNLPSARANENRVFQQLDECLRQCKLLVREFAADGEIITPSEEEVVLRAAEKQLFEQLRSSGQKSVNSNQSGAKQQKVQVSQQSGAEQ